MEIIKELNDTKNEIEPSTHHGVCEIWKHCVEHVIKLDTKVDYNLVELGMFGSNDSISDSNG